MDTRELWFMSSSYRADLTIVSQDFTDMMYMWSMVNDKTGYKNKKHLVENRTKSMPIRETDYKNTIFQGYVAEWSCILVFVKTTSGKAWAYPIHGKHPGRVLANFKQFLNDIGFNEDFRGLKMFFKVICNTNLRCHN